MTPIEQRVIETLRTVINRRSEVSLEMRLRDDLRVTSLMLVELVTDLCEAFDVSVAELNEADLANVTLVRDVSNLFAKKAGHSPSLA